MRKLLNTLYITQENAYLSLEGETIVCRLENEEKFRIPFDNVEGVVCFSYIGCSPALMGKCVEKQVLLSFISPQGKYLAGVGGGTRGNVHLRVAQIDKFRENALVLTQNTVAAKLGNTLHLLKRSMHDNAALRQDEALLSVVEVLKNAIESVYDASDTEQILGIEGNCAHRYFSVFGRLMTAGNTMTFTYRNQHPPLDPANALLSFLYTIYTNEFASALYAVGLDPYIGYYHALRSGRVSLACDLVEECRCIVERFALTLLNLRIITEEDFEKQMSGAVWLSNDGRKKVLTKWQEKKRTDFMHPYLKQKIQFGLLPYVQSNLLAKYVRGELEEYPCYLAK